MLNQITRTRVTENNINEYGRYDELRESVDWDRASKYFKAVYGENLKDWEISTIIDSLLRDYLLSGGFEIPSPGKANESKPD